MNQILFCVSTMSLTECGDLHKHTNQNKDYLRSHITRLSSSSQTLAESQNNCITIVTLRSHPIRENVKRSSFLINKSTNAYHNTPMASTFWHFLFFSLSFSFLPLSLCLHPGSTLKWTIETCIHTNSWEHSVCQSAGLSYLVFDAQLANSPLGPFRMGAQGRPCALSADVFQALYLIVSGCISVTWCSYKTLCLSIGRESYLYLSVGSLTATF